MLKAEIVAKSCLSCQNFQISFGYPGYSELTPGSPPSISCDKVYKRGCRWSKAFGGTSGSTEPPAFIEAAKDCLFYEQHQDLRITNQKDQKKLTKPRCSSYKVNDYAINTYGSELAGDCLRCETCGELH